MSTECTGVCVNAVTNPVPSPAAQTYGKIFRLSFGPKTFVVISDPKYTKQILQTNADK